MSSQANKKRNSRSRFTQLTDVMSFPADVKALKEELKRRVVIDPPTFGTVPNSTPEIKFVKKFFGIKNSDGTEGELVLDTDRLFCFGVSEAKAPDTGILNGYSMAISMYDRDGATERQMRTVQFINVLTDVLKEHLLLDETKNETEFYELEAADLKKFNPLYLKKDKGKIVEGSAPTFYPKLIHFKAGKDKNGKPRDAKMMTKFYLEDEVDDNGDSVEVNPLDYIGVRFHATTAVKFECIYMSAKTINIQTKATEAEIKAAETGPKRLLRVGNGARQPSIGMGVSSNPLMRGPTNDEKGSDHDDNNDESSSVNVERKIPESKKEVPLVASDDEQPPEEEPEEKAKTKKRVVRKVKVNKGEKGNDK